MNSTKSNGNISVFVVVLTLLVLALQGAFMTLKLQGQLDWDWAVTFIPSYTLILSYFVGVITVASRWWESNPIRQMQLSQILTKHNKDKKQLEDKFAQLEMAVKAESEDMHRRMESVTNETITIADSVREINNTMSQIYDEKNTVVELVEEDSDESSLPADEEDTVDQPDTEAEPEQETHKLEEEKTKKVMDSPFVQTVSKSRFSFTRALFLLGLSTVIGGIAVAAWSQPGVPETVQEWSNVALQWLQSQYDVVINFFS